MIIEKIATHDLYLLLGYVREDFVDGRNVVHQEDMGLHIVVLLIQPSKELQSMIFYLSLINQFQNSTRASNITRTNRIGSKVLDLILNNA